MLLVGIRLSGMAIVFLRRRASRETRAVYWIQGVSIFYALAVYLFLNWMIMGSPVYPFATASWRLPCREWNPGQRTTGQNPGAAVFRLPPRWSAESGGMPSSRC